MPIHRWRTTSPINVVMSRTTRVNPLPVLVSILVGTSIGEWLGGTLNDFVAALVSIPVAGDLQVIVL